MKKFAFSLLCLLLALGARAQAQVLVSGLVTDINDGSPVANQEIFVSAGDSVQYAFGSGLTDQSGAYVIPIDMPPGFSEVYVSTFTACDPNGSWTNQVAPVVNNEAHADFQVCRDSFPPFPNCYTYINAVQQDSLTFSFSAYWFANDSNEVAVSYVWDFGDGTTSTDPNPVHTYAQDGWYVVTVTVTGSNGCASTGEYYIQTDTPPFPDCYAYIDILPTDSLTFSFTSYYYAFDSTAVGVEYLWDFGDGTTSNEANPVHTYAQDGFYLVNLTVTGSNGCTATAQYPLETSFPGFPECSGYITYTQSDTVTFTFTAELYNANGAIIQASDYNWDFGDGQTSTEASPTHTYAQQGVYTVQLHALTDDSCEVHLCSVVFALDCPIDTFWYGCQAMFYVGFDSLSNPTWPPLDPLTLQFFDASLGGAMTWHWDFGDGDTSTLQNPVHTYDAPGIYTVTLEITTLNGCESQSSFEICVGDDCWGIPEYDCQAMFIPLPDSTGSGNGLQFIDLSYTQNPIQSWSWNFGDGTTSNEQNPYHIFAQPGVYTVTLSIEADSCSSSISFVIDTQNPWNFTTNNDPAKLGVATGSVATKEPRVFEGFKLFPNPVSTEFSLVFNSTKSTDYVLNILDLTGRTVIQNPLSAQTGLNAAHADVSKLAPGIYMAEIRSGEMTHAMKFIKH